jgi:transposase
MAMPVFHLMCCPLTDTVWPVSDILEMRSNRARMAKEKPRTACRAGCEGESVDYGQWTTCAA